MLSKRDREIIEQTIRILMKEHYKTDEPVNIHNAAEALRLVLNPTYVGIF